MAILVGVVIVITLSRVMVANFIIRGVADTRVAWPREWLAAAAERFPDSARVNFRLANAEIAGVVEDERFGIEAERHAMRAVNLSPWDYRLRRLLATAQELNGKQDEAAQVLREAVALAPNHAELNWSYANLLLRRGRLEESLGPFRVAAKARAGMLPSAIETIWRSSGGSLETLRVFAGDDSESLLAVVKFLIEQSHSAGNGADLMAEAVAIYNSIDREAKIASPQSPELISALLRAGRIGLAKSAWVDLVMAYRPEAQMSGGDIWNGGFEIDVAPGLEQFDWVIRHSKYARVGIDQNMGRNGGRSLRVVFSGLDTTTLRDEAWQTVALKPGASYRLECYAKARELTLAATTGGPRVAIIGQGGVIAATEPAPEGSWDWRPLAVSFVAPANSPLATVAIVMTPRFSYDEPTRGMVWFDDFSLIEQ